MLSQSLRDEYDFEYTMELQLTNSPAVSADSIPYTFIMDTGSSDAWVMGLDCQSCVNLQSQDQEGQEINFQDLEDVETQLDDINDSELVEIMYGDGSVEGYPIEDSAYLPGVDQAITLPFLYIVDQELQSGQDTSGLIGLGFPGAKNQSSDTFIDSLYNADLIQDKVFMMNINDGGQDNQSDQEDGIVFGSESVRGVLQQSGVDQDTDVAWLELEVCQWQSNDYSLQFVDFSQVQLGAHDEEGDTGFVVSITDNYAILDSGTSFTYLPDAVIGQIKTQLTSQMDCGDIWDPDWDDQTFICNGSAQNYDQIDDLLITLNGIEFRMPKEAYLQYDASQQFGELTIQGGGDDITIFGDSFMKQYQVIHDQDNQMIGIAKKNQLCNQLNQKQNTNQFALGIEISDQTVYLQLVAGLLSIIGILIFILDGCFCWPTEKRVKSIRTNDLDKLLDE